MAEELPPPDDDRPAHDHTFDDEPCDGCTYDERHPDVDPYDAAEHDLIEFIRKHRPRNLTVELADRTAHRYLGRPYVAVYGPGDNERREIPLDAAGDGG